MAVTFVLGPMKSGKTSYIREQVDANKTIFIRSRVSDLEERSYIDSPSLSIEFGYFMHVDEFMDEDFEPDVQLQKYRDAGVTTVVFSDMLLMEAPLKDKVGLTELEESMQEMAEEFHNRCIMMLAMGFTDIYITSNIYFHDSTPVLIIVYLQNMAWPYKKVVSLKSRCEFRWCENTTEYSSRRTDKDKKALLTAKDAYVTLCSSHSTRTDEPDNYWFSAHGRVRHSRDLVRFAPMILNIQKYQLIHWLANGDYSYLVSVICHLAEKDDISKYIQTHPLEDIESGMHGIVNPNTMDESTPSRPTQENAFRPKCPGCLTALDLVRGIRGNCGHFTIHGQNLYSLLLDTGYVICGLVKGKKFACYTMPRDRQLYMTSKDTETSRQLRESVVEYTKSLAEAFAGGCVSNNALISETECFLERVRRDHAQSFLSKTGDNPLAHGTPLENLAQASKIFGEKKETLATPEIVRAAMAREVESCVVKFENELPEPDKSLPDQTMDTDAPTPTPSR